MIGDKYVHFIEKGAVEGNMTGGAMDPLCKTIHVAYQSSLKNIHGKIFCKWASKNKNHPLGLVNLTISIDDVNAEDPSGFVLKFFQRINF